MIGLIRYCKGYLKIKVWGYAPQRFMNLCTNRGIMLWGVEGYGGYYTMYLGLSDFFVIRDIVRKTKTKVAVVERHGLPFFMQDVKKRKIFAMGIFWCSAFLILMSRFIWSIQFEGNRMVTDDELYDFLAAQGVDYGTKKKDLNLEALEAAIRENYSQVTWTSARVDGTKITVAIKENDLPTEKEREQDREKFADGADLVAAKDGTVTKILTRSGVPRVKQGDEVKKGDILVSGLVPVQNDDGTVRSFQKVVSDADVMIQCREGVSLTQPLAYQYKNYTGREKQYRFFSVFGKRYRFPMGKPQYVCYDEVIEQKRLQLFSQVDLPVFRGTMVCREYLPVDAMYDENSAISLLERRLEKIINTLEEKGVQIIQKDVKIVRKADTLMMQGSLLANEEAVVLAASGAIEDQQVELP